MKKFLWGPRPRGKINGHGPEMKLPPGVLTGIGRDYCRAQGENLEVMRQNGRAVLPLEQGQADGGLSIMNTLIEERLSRLAAGRESLALEVEGLAERLALPLPPGLARVGWSRRKGAFRRLLDLRRRRKGSQAEGQGNGMKGGDHDRFRYTTGD